MAKKYKKKNNAYQKLVGSHLRALRGIFAAASIGDFSKDVPLYEKEDEFTELYMGVQIMLDVIRMQIADLERFNKELSRKVKELEREVALRKNFEKRKDQFIAVLGHELRNPLSPIMHAVEILLMDARKNNSAEKKEMLSIIERQSSHMARLIHELLDVSRMLHGKIELQMQNVNVSSVVENAAQSVRASIEEKNHDFTIDVPKKQIILRADPFRLEQIIVNLLTNAARYTDPGGKIFLRVEAQGNDALIRVRDTGMGIPRKEISEIFNFFTRKECSFADQHEGLGMGLTIAQGLARLHGGNITAKSPGKGKGSEFTVRIPIVSKK